MSIIKLPPPIGNYCGQGPCSANDEIFPSYCIEMDVDDSFVLYAWENYEGNSYINQYDTYSINSNYASIELVAGTGNIYALVAKKNTAGAKEDPRYPDYIVLTLTKKRGDETDIARILVRIYDKPTGLKIYKNTKEIDPAMPDVPTNGKLLLGDGLEVKPGESFDVYFKVLPKTAQQAVRLYSNCRFMKSNIQKMTVKDNPGKGAGVTTFTLSKDACYHAGDPGFKNPKVFGTFISPKRKGSPSTEVQLQVVEYKSEEPKPLDFVTTSMPGGDKYPVGGRFGTIDGGLRINKDCYGRILIKDVYRKLIPDPKKCPAVAIILEMTKKATGYSAICNLGIHFSYHWDALRESPVKYEVPGGTKPKYRNSHGLSVALFPYGKKVKWCDNEYNFVLSTGPGWLKADKQYGRMMCYDEDGFRLTAHYQYYNKFAPEKEKMIPVSLLEEYHNRYRTIKYVTHYDEGEFTVTSWFIPSLAEICKMTMTHLKHSGTYNPLQDYLGERLRYFGGFKSDIMYNFWTSCIYQDEKGERDYHRAMYAFWFNSALGTGNLDKRAEEDFLPFFRF